MRFTLINQQSMKKKRQCSIDQSTCEIDNNQYPRNELNCAPIEYSLNEEMQFVFQSRLFGMIGSTIARKHLSRTNSSYQIEPIHLEEFQKNDQTILCKLYRSWLVVFFAIVLNKIDIKPFSRNMVKKSLGYSTKVCSLLISNCWICSI